MIAAGQQLPSSTRAQLSARTLKALTPAGPVGHQLCPEDPSEITRCLGRVRGLSRGEEHVPDLDLQGTSSSGEARHFTLEGTDLAEERL